MVDVCRKLRIFCVAEEMQNQLQELRISFSPLRILLAANSKIPNFKIMSIEIRENLKYHLYGFSGIVPNFKFGETGIALSSRMWDIVKKNSIPNKGINIWVYDDRTRMFCGVELDPRPSNNFGMEERDVHLVKYAWYKHIGPYQLLPESNEKMKQEMQKLGLKYGPPSLEIYGHHGPDPSKLETELIFPIYS